MSLVMRKPWYAELHPSFFRCSCAGCEGNWKRFQLRPRIDAASQAVIYWIQMREILEIEEHVPIPPMMYSDPFYRITYLIKEEIRKYKWTEGEKGRKLSWEQARKEWTDAYQEKYERFLIDTLYFPEANSQQEQPIE